jgi:hypothetical protein
MSAEEIQPPKTAEWLLDLFTPYEEAESIRGDLFEEFSSLALLRARGGGIGGSASNPSGICSLVRFAGIPGRSPARSS